MANEPDIPDPTEEARVVIHGEIVRSKVEEAYQLRLSGMSHSDIADVLGYTTGVEVAQALRMRFKSDATKLTTEDRDSILQMELDRLDKLRTKHWEAAMLGDLPSGEMLLKIHDRVVKITGIDGVDTATQQATVLVIGGIEKDYVAALKELS